VLSNIADTQVYAVIHYMQMLILYDAHTNMYVHLLIIAQMCYFHSFTHTEQLSTYRGGLGTRYNALRVERFARIHCLRSAYFAWRALARRLGRGTKMQRRVLTRLLRAVFHEWAVEAKRSCRLRVSHYMLYIYICMCVCVYIACIILCAKIVRVGLAT
jgi:hypothetical protein